MAFEEKFRVMLFFLKNFPVGFCCFLLVSAVFSCYLLFFQKNLVNFI